MRLEWFERPSATSKIKDKEKARPSTVRYLACFDCLDKVGKPTERDLPRVPAEVGQLGKTRTIWYNGGP